MKYSHVVASLFFVGFCSTINFTDALPKQAQSLTRPEIRKFNPNGVQIVPKEDKPIITNETSSKIVGGTNVPEGGAPHQIGVLFPDDNTFICGGSFIGSQVVLTAAHCVYGNENQPQNFRIRYGHLDIRRGTDIKVTKVTRHPSYSDKTIVNDVAVLHLASAFSPSTNAAIIQLATSNPPAGSSVQVTGWGLQKAGGNSIPDTLQMGRLLTISQSDCQKRWTSMVITEGMLCAFDTIQSACNGDSGGPLTFNGELVGVVSWGHTTCSTYPNVYSSVANYNQWINETSVTGGAHSVKSGVTAFVSIVAIAVYCSTRLFH